MIRLLLIETNVKRLPLLFWSEIRKICFNNFFDNVSYFQMSHRFLPFVYPGEKGPPEMFQSVAHKASIFVLLCGTILKLLCSGF